jgi:hypothetical protein
LVTILNWSDPGVFREFFEASPVCAERPENKEFMNMGLGTKIPDPKIFFYSSVPVTTLSDMERVPPVHNITSFKIT